MLFRSDEVASGLLQARAEVKPTVPIVVRLVGTNQDEGRRLLHEGGIDAFTTMKEAAAAVVAAAPARNRRREMVGRVRDIGDTSVDGRPTSYPERHRRRDRRRHGKFPPNPFFHLTINP